MIRTKFSPETFYPWGKSDDPKPEVGAIFLCHLEPWDSSGSADTGAFNAFQTEMRFAEHDAWDALDGPSMLTTNNTVVGWRPLGDDVEIYVAKYGRLQD